MIGVVARLRGYIVSKNHTMATHSLRQQQRYETAVGWG